MKASLTALILVLGIASFARADNAASMVSQDPLTQQIRLRQLTEPNGGVTGFRVDPQGKVVQIEAVDLSAQPLGGAKPAPSARPGTLDGLKPHKDLLPKAGGRAKSKTIEQPKAQLDRIDGHKKW